MLACELPSASLMFGQWSWLVPSEHLFLSAASVVSWVLTDDNSVNIKLRVDVNWPMFGGCGHVWGGGHALCGGHVGPGVGPSPLIAPAVASLTAQRPTKKCKGHMIA